MKVLVCGSRNYHNFDEINSVLLLLKNLHGIDLIIHGGAHGADALASLWAILNNVPQIQFKPEWKKYGKAAGPMRNKKMLEEGLPDMVIAFPKDGDLSASKGTRNMVEQARQAGITTIVHGEKTAFEHGLPSHG